MHSPMMALAWQHWWRHRVGLAVVLLSLFPLAVFVRLRAVGDPTAMQAYLSSFLFFIALVYVAAVFAFGFETKLEGRESGFPIRLFTLPVRTVVLVGWPMLQGIAIVT